MYSFIFYFFYKFAEKKNPSPSIIAICYVSLTQLFHAFLVVSILMNVVGINFNISMFSDNYVFNKIYTAPLFIPWLIVNYIFFKKRTNTIIEKYDEKNEKPLSFINTIKVLLIMILPLIVAIQLMRLGKI